MRTVVPAEVARVGPVARVALRAGLAAGLVGGAVAGCGETVAVRHVDKVPASPGAAATSAALPHDPCAVLDSRVAGGAHKKARWKREPLPADFKPVVLITCDEQDRTTAATGEWTYRIEKHATEGLAAVVAALRSTPPPPPTGGYACTLDLISDPWFLLVDRAGRVVLPVVPHERACNKPINLGLDRLHYTVVSSKRLMQQATPAELATDCTGQWKNEPRIFADMSRQQPATSRQTVDSPPVSVCIYSSRSSKDPEVGDFRGGARLSADETRQIGKLLTGDAPRAGFGSCEPAPDYAVVHTAGSSWVYVELSGCKRLIVDEGQTWTAPVPELVRAINDLHLRH